MLPNAREDYPYESVSQGALVNFRFSDSAGPICLARHGLGESFERSISEPLRGVPTSRIPTARGAPATPLSLPGSGT